MNHIGSFRSVIGRNAVLADVVARTDFSESGVAPVTGSDAIVELINRHCVCDVCLQLL